MGWRGTNRRDYRPESLGPEFRETCMEYLNQVIDLAEKVMHALAIALEIPQHYVDEFCANPMGAGSLARLASPWTDMIRSIL